jgi:hypothetical protein
MIIGEEHSATSFGHTSLLSQLKDPPQCAMEWRNIKSAKRFKKALGAARTPSIAPLGGSGAFASQA